MNGLTRVEIAFETSHLVFPTLVGGVLAVLGLLIVLTRWRAVAGAGHMWSGIFAAMDKPRFFGTLALTLVYFSAMVPVGDVWPNEGFGFLFCSIPFVALTGLLFMQDRRREPLIVLGITSLVAPAVVWWLFGDVFFLSLP